MSQSLTNFLIPCVAALIGIPVGVYYYYTGDKVYESVGCFRVLAPRKAGQELYPPIDHEQLIRNTEFVNEAIEKYEFAGLECFKGMEADSIHPNLKNHRIIR